MMIAYAGREIEVHNPTPEVRDYIIRNLSWDNPEYEKKLRMGGKGLWNEPRTICLYKRKGDSYTVPYGVMGKLRAMGVQIEPQSHLISHERLFGAKVEGLYPYQTKALQAALNAKNGVLVAPCGSGKTQMGIAIAAALGMRTLWLTHTHELLKQSMERARRYLNIPMSTITDGMVDASGMMVFATVQTLAKVDISDLHEHFDVIIVDECHRCIGTPTRMTMFYKVLSGLSARYKFGLTATPKRSDGMEKAMYAILGDKFYEVSKEDVKDATVPLKVGGYIRTGWSPDEDAILNEDGTLNYTALVSECTQSAIRNRVVADTIDFAADMGSTMVLSERVAHLEALQAMCKHESVNLSTARGSRAERRNAIDAIRNGSARVIFATYAIAREGLDIPNLAHIVMASPVKNEITVQQSVGRVLRAFADKECGYVYDFIDDMGMLMGWLRKRERIYRRLEK